MQIKNLLPLALGATVSAQSLTEALAANNASLSVLTTLLGTNPTLVETLSGLTDITILAPNNAALNAFVNSSAAAGASPELISAILTYHVLNGTYPASAFTNSSQFLPTLLNAPYANVTGGQVVGGKLNGTEVNIYSGLLQTSTVVEANLNFTGGVIHIIDTVLTIPQPPSDTAAAANLTALVGALNFTSLIDAVDNLEDVTIFAPSNAAFAAIASAAGNLTAEVVGDILQYHVVNGTVVYSSLITGNTTLTTLGGGNITVSVIDGEVFINSAKVVVPDVLVGNGVVHVIDGVLNPGNATAAPNPSTTAVAFPGASTASNGNIPFTSGVAAPSTTITNAPTQAGAPGAGASSSSRAGAAKAMQTGAIGVGALLGGALMMNL